MKVGICTIESRLDNYTKQLVDCLKPECSNIKLFIDKSKRGHFWNYRRMLKEMLTNAKKDEPILLCTDDVILPKGWKKYWENIHAKANNDIYGLFSRQRHLFNKENLKRGYVTKCQKRGLYDQAIIYINQQQLPQQVDEWYARNYELMGKHRRKHFDVVVQDAIVSTGKEYTILTPCLVNHIGVKSSLGHKVGGAVKYVG